METQEVVSKILMLKQKIKDEVVLVCDERLKECYAKVPFFLFGEKRRQYVRKLEKITQEYVRHPLVLELQSLREKCSHVYSDWQSTGEPHREKRQCSICDKEEYRINLSYSGTMLG